MNESMAENDENEEDNNTDSRSETNFFRMFGRAHAASGCMFIYKKKCMAEGKGNG